MRAAELAERREEEPGNQIRRSIDDDRPADHSCGAGPDRPRASRPRCAGHGRENTHLRRAARRGAAGRRGDDRPRRRRRRPGRHLVAEHLALGGRLPGHALRGRRCRPAEHPLHRQRGRRHPGPHRGAAADRDGRVPRRPTASPTWTAINCPRCGTSCGCPSTRTTAPGTSSWPAANRTWPPPMPAPPPCNPTTSPTSCSPPAPPAAARACCARTGSRCRRRRRGRRAVRSPVPTAICASTRSSTTSGTRPASWPACRPAPP